MGKSKMKTKEMDFKAGASISCVMHRHKKTNLQLQSTAD